MASLHLPLPVGVGDPDLVIHGDSLAVAAAHAGAGLALVYIDPPFGTGRIQRGQGGRYHDDGDDPVAHVAWLAPWLAASKDALATTGSLVVHLDWRAVHYAKVELDRLFGRACFVNEIAWCYSVGGKSRRGFGRKHDTLLWYGRTPGWAFYPDAVRIPRKGGSHMKVERDADGNPVQLKTDRKTGRVYRYPVADGKIPEDWWVDIETLNRSDRERTGWPSQKPVRLLERIILATTTPGDRVADWFAGSGTTAVAAQRHGRRFVVADAAAEAVEHMRTRLTAQAVELAAAGTAPPPVAYRAG
ncbi:MAG: site-specific DNA-methyltransferase [Kofleriaceae bacterium]